MKYKQLFIDLLTTRIEQLKILQNSYGQDLRTPKQVKLRIAELEKVLDEILNE